MKTCYTYWIIIVLLASAGASMAVVVNVPITNASFESPVVAGEVYGAPQGWTSLGEADNIALYNDPAHAFAKDGSQVAGIHTYHSGMSQVLTTTAKAGRVYTISAWIWGQDADFQWTTLGLQAVDPSNPASTVVIVQRSDFGAPGWNFVSLTSPPTPADQDGWPLMVMLWGGRGWAYFDSVSLTYTSTELPAGFVAAPGSQPGYGGLPNKVIHSKTGIELVLIAPGTFTMGTNLLGSDCLPPHTVTINYPFYMGKTEVTNGQYGQFNATGYNGTADVDPAYDLYLRHLRGKSYMPSGDNYPIVWVSWKNAKAFCNWAGGLDLASESEWEYACRAGTTAQFSFGDDKSILNQYGWTLENAGAKTHPVATLQPNQWGLYDMHGNVWEWVMDDFVYNYDGAPTNGSARVEGKMTKAIRSGSWSNSTHAQYAGSASRFNSAPGNASNDLGFRVIMRP